MMKTILFLISLSTLISLPLHSKSNEKNNLNQYRGKVSQDTLVSNKIDTALSDEEGDKSSGKHFMTNYEYTLSEFVLLFGVVLIVCELILIKITNVDANTSFKLIAVTLIITAILFLITAGYDSAAITPATGLLGTIAGYLLGKTDSSTNRQNPS